MEGSTEVPVWSIVIHVLSLVAVALPIPLFYLFGSPTQRGFYCDDTSILYPYHESTVPASAVVVFGLVIPSIVMLILEYFNIKRNKLIWNRFSVLGKVVPEYLVHAFRIVGIFLFGAAASHVITDTSKYTVGRLRPHFWDVCKPGNVCDGDPRSYIEDFVCQGTDEDRLHNARLSFMSGHASLSSYTMLFFALYLHFRFKFVGVATVRVLIQYVCILLSLYTCFTRVMDNQHHPGDVVAGLVQGTIVALVTFYLSSISLSKEIQEENGELQHINDHSA